MKKEMLKSFVIKGNTANIEKDKMNVVKFLNAETNKEKQEAFAELYKRYSETIRYYMLRNVKGYEETADDLTQDVFTKVYEKMHLYKAENAFSTWLFRIATNTLIDFKRSDKVEVLSMDSLKVNSNSDEETTENVFQIVDNSSNVEKIIDKSERAEAVRIAIDNIKNPKQKQAIELFFFEELSIEEIASKMDECENTVKGLIFRGKASIQASFANQEVEAVI